MIIGEAPTVIAVERPTDLQLITHEMLVGELERELSYQYAEERATLAKRLIEAGSDVPERREFERTVGGIKDRRLLAEIDARTYFRLLELDPYFFDDKKNVKKLLEDNPEMKGGVGR